MMSQLKTPPTDRAAWAINMALCGLGLHSPVMGRDGECCAYCLRGTNSQTTTYKILGYAPKK